MHKTIRMKFQMTVHIIVVEYRRPECSFQARSHLPIAHLRMANFLRPILVVDHLHFQLLKASECTQSLEDKVIRRPLLRVETQVDVQDDLARLARDL